jgi:hypothetical protein
MKLSQEQVIQAALETAIPDFPEAERTEDKELEFKEMMYEEYIKSLPRKERRELTDKKYSFSKQIKKKLRGEY